MESQDSGAGLNISAVRPFAWSREAKPLLPLYGWFRVALISWTVQLLAYLVLILAIYLALAEIENGVELTGFKLAAFEVSFIFDGMLVAGLSVAVFAVAAVLYCWYFYRAMRNLHRSSARGELMSPVGVVLWNFVPIAWLWLPRKAVGQIWRVSTDPLQGRYDPPGHINLWWAAWLGSGILSTISSRIVVEEGDFENMRMSIVFEGLASLLMLIAIFTLLPLARQIAVAQDKRLSEALARPVAGPAPA